MLKYADTNYQKILEARNNMRPLIYKKQFLLKTKIKRFFKKILAFLR
jgi:hypothetical protein